MEENQVPNPEQQNNNVTGKQKTKKKMGPVKGLLLAILIIFFKGRPKSLSSTYLVLTTTLPNCIPLSVSTITRSFVRVNIKNEHLFDFFTILW